MTDKKQEQNCSHPFKLRIMVGEKILDGLVQVSLLCTECGSMTNPAIFPARKVRL